jgi:uncharacterized protein YdiU (UPF0061 family)
MNSINWRFDNTYARLPATFYSRLDPVPVRQARTVILNHRLAERLGLDLSLEAAPVLAGSVVPEGAEPLAQAYAGHQFGNFTMLGDGRAILLGEHIAPDGVRFDIQLKGSGPTPFSRRGDGRAALGPMLREYIISEAMHALRIATTRSLAVVATGEPVYREDVLPGAVLTRVASSHLRVGTFQYAAAMGDIEGLKALTSYALDRHYPQLSNSENQALALLEAVIERQAGLVVEWMRVGFIHGVMNTDNMTISGETIDYGPCAFLESYDPGTAYSSIDVQKRYAFANQPKIAQWNLARFAEALLPLIDADETKAVEIANAKIGHFGTLYLAGYMAMMRRKLGLAGDEAADGKLIDDLLGWMQKHRADYTNTFRHLADADMPAEAHEDADFQRWHERWQERMRLQPGAAAAASAMMRTANPAYIPRNQKVEEVLLAATEDGDTEPLHALLSVLAEPYSVRPQLEGYRQPMPAVQGPYRTYCGT